MTAEPTCLTVALLRRHRAGDADALQELLRRYYPRVERIVRVRLGRALATKTTVDDLVQDVFLRVIESLDTYEERDDAGWIDWVAKLVQREISNQARYHRAAKRDGPMARVVGADESERGPDLPADTTAVPSKVSRDELKAVVDACLTELPENHREVVLLRDYAGLEWPAVAERMSSPTVPAAQELYRRARKSLAEKVRRAT